MQEGEAEILESKILDQYKSSMESIPWPDLGTCPFLPAGCRGLQMVQTFALLSALMMLWRWKIWLWVCVAYPEASLMLIDELARLNLHKPSQAQAISRESNHQHVESARETRSTL